MKTLFARLSSALLIIVLLIGGGFYWVEQFSTRLYYEELTQRLNASIAMYVTGERTLIENDEVNTQALELLAQQAMIINPTVEVYLLDREGTILGHALPPEEIQASAVDLTPVKALIEGNVKMPFKGPDPRNPARKKIFSAFPVMHEERLQGYLYAILGGKKYDELASSIRGSYVQKISLGAITAIVLGGFLTGLLVFSLMTRRLTRLTRDVQRFTRSGFDPAVAIIPHPDTDEIGQLGSAFSIMADKIEQQFESLKETDRLRRELVSNVSHDLRTPLASMHGYVDTLLIKNESLSNEERKHYLEITRKHTQRLGRLIGDLFELSKLDSASIKPNLEDFSLAELLHDVSQEFELDAQKRGVIISVEAAPDPAMVCADIGLMQRVLENLLRNALKFTPAGGRITISLKAQTDSVAVAVADTGCGIAEEDLEHIFDRFYRVETGQRQIMDDPGTADLGSTGLGLAIVKRILDLHGSRITVVSSVNEGTRFEFEIPTRMAA